jgi:hypothetical protein
MNHPRAGEHLLSNQQLIIQHATTSNIRDTYTLALQHSRLVRRKEAAVSKDGNLNFVTAENS